MPIEFQVIIGIAYALLGLCLGSFSNVLIYRLSNHISLFEKSRSFCPKCEHEIKWYDNIPIISYLVLKGRCRNCKEKISIQYPIVEACGLIIGVACFLLNYYELDLLVGFEFVFNYKSIVFLFMAIILLNVSVIDHKTYEIPFELSIPFMILCMGTYVADCVIAQDWGMWNVIGFAGPAVFLGLIYLLPLLIKKVEVMGLGDIILYSFIGLAFGLWQIILIIMISTLVCSIVELIKIKVTGEKKQIPFGPYIAGATVFCMFFGEYIVSLYLNLVGLGK